MMACLMDNKMNRVEDVVKRERAGEMSAYSERNPRAHVHRGEGETDVLVGRKIDLQDC